MINKVFKVGDSAAVTIPKKVLRDMRLRIGDHVTLDYDAAQTRLHVSPLQRQRHGITPRTQVYLEEFMRQYGPMLRKLSRR